MFNINIKIESDYSLARKINNEVKDEIYIDEVVDKVLKSNGLGVFKVIGFPWECYLIIKEIDGHRIAVSVAHHKKLLPSMAWVDGESKAADDERQKLLAKVI